MINNNRQCIRVDQYDESNLKQYLKDTRIKYYDPKIIITILEDVLGKSIEMVKKDLDDLKINVTEEKIKKYLNDKSIEEKKSNYKVVMPEPTWFNKHPTAEDRYRFDSYTLEYFFKFSSIVRYKARKILNIMEKIVLRDCSSVSDLLIDFDIRLDENGKISRDDITRLIPPFIENYNTFIEIVNAANNLETYLTFKKSDASFTCHGALESQLYPSLEFQWKHLYKKEVPKRNCTDIGLSSNQVQMLRNEEETRIEEDKKMEQLLLQSKNRFKKTW